MSSSETKKCPYCAEEIRAEAVFCRFCQKDLSQPADPPQKLKPEKTDEIVYLQTPDAYVTNTRAILHGVTYSMVNITSVRLLKNDRDITVPVVIGLFGLLSLFVAAKAEISAFYIVAGVLFVIGVVLGFMCKPTFAVVIMGAGGENQAMTSKKRNAVQEVVDALSKAIVGRG